MDNQYNAMVSWIERRGVSVDLAPMGNSCRGQWLSIDRVILINSDLHGVDKLKTLIHEAAHALMYEMCSRQATLLTSRDAKEVYAELTAMRTMALLGVDTSDYSWKYINSYIGSVGGWKSIDQLAEYSARRLYVIMK